LLLDVSQISINLGGMKVVRNVSFGVDAGRRLALIGPNGAGKSSLVNVICGVNRHHEGKIHLDDHDITGLPPFRRARRGVGRTFQNLELFTTMSVSENLRVSLESSRAGKGSPGHGPARRQAEVDDMLRQMGLESYRDRILGELPYGLRKLAEIARCLICSPRIVLLDEPVAGLDTAEKSECIERLDSLLADRDVAVLLVEHDMRAVERMCGDHVVVLDAGQVIARGSFEEIARQPQVLEAYLGAPVTPDEPDAR
jgi:branched-chain amino acid transport system ATP-binding protein